MTNHKPLVFCAIDTAEKARALEIAKTIGPITGGLKLGLEFFSAFGPDGVEEIMDAAPGAALFLDLKFHDIPNTVGRAVETLSKRLNPAYLNVHAAGGSEMMRVARKSCAPGTKLLAVTVLTSLTDDDLHHVGQGLSVMDQVQRLALLAKDAGLDGVVCSALEIEAIRRDCGEDFTLMVPGIRPSGAPTADQRRIMEPRKALQKGANHLVIGRPITESKDIAAAAQEILAGLRD